MSATHLLTADEFFQLPDPPDKCIELIDGEVREKPLLGMLSGFAKGNVFTTLSGFVKQHDLGLVLPGLGCVLERNPDTVRIVGVSFFTWERVPEGEPTEFFWEGAPSLAVEVVSQDDLAIDFRDRVDDYLEAGTQQV